jgi:hypothetical protein
MERDRGELARALGAGSLASRASAHRTAPSAKRPVLHGSTSAQLQGLQTWGVLLALVTVRARVAR